MSTAVPIEFKCPGCGRTLKAPADKAGLSFPCPACKGPVTVPGVEEPVTPTLVDPSPLLLDGLRSIDDRIRKAGMDLRIILVIMSVWSFFGLIAFLFMLRAAGL